MNWESKKLKELDAFVRRCMEERLEQLEVEMNDEKNEALEKRNSSIYKNISEVLPDSLKDEMREYSDNSGELCGITERYYYKCGFKDAVSLLQLLSGIDC